MATPSTNSLPLSGYSSSNSSNGSGNHKKRPAQAITSNGRPSSTSGYSADREENLAPPVVSIDLHGGNRQTSADNDPNACEKRRNTLDVQFTASTVKADLARAGTPYPKFDFNKEKTSQLGSVCIDLKGVRLIHSIDTKNAPVIASNGSAKPTTLDYEMLMAACVGSYNTKVSRSKTVSSSQDSDGTSSVSDTESDASDGVAPIFIVPPLLEDSLGHEKMKARKQESSVSTCHIISSSATAVTITEMLQLSTKARLVTKSCTPFSIVHANAAFARLTGLTSNSILGSAFPDLLVRNSDDRQINLGECAVASSNGSYKSFRFRLQSSDSEESIECRIKVSPIVARKTATSEVTNVTHFAIEVLSDYDGDSRESESRVGRAAATEGMSQSHVGVMG